MTANPVPTMGAHWPFALQRHDTSVSYMDTKEGKCHARQLCALTNACQRLDLIRHWTAVKINLSNYNDGKPGAPKHGNGHDGEEETNSAVYTRHSLFCCTIGT